MTEIEGEAHCTAVRDGHAECTCGWRSMPVFGDAEPIALWHRLSVGETINNPYLRAFLAPVTSAEIAASGSEFLAAFLRRDRLVAEYAWAIPTESVVRRLAELSPICDLGCGTGYWARMLTDADASVLAVDVHPPLEGENHWHKKTVGLMRQPIALRHFTNIVQGDVATFDVPIDHTLMLCWPPYASAMAAVALSRYCGGRVIFIGENDGCTGDETFHAMLSEQWDLTARYEIPQWFGLHDDVSVYTRKTP